ncbi:heavy-metal-associated domain-containing protein [uncultured Pseudonocardia sp.]|jgi:copper chaperone|uniref:heavy-metal-associated domain-containing protein n=1 Tax=uncultured Pseudonocardia sp. TaxID=211455 RepID=UPI00262649F4|nr:heavy-metal-associated domain-containing protein [uncultured Pseudonocardia sp.]
MQTVSLQVEGMSCGGCEERLGAVLRRVEGVREVRAQHTSGRVQVRCGPELADPAVLARRIVDAGFTVTSTEVAR